MPHVAVEKDGKMKIVSSTSKPKSSHGHKSSRDEQDHKLSSLQDKLEEQLEDNERLQQQCQNLKDTGRQLAAESQNFQRLAAQWKGDHGSLKQAYQELVHRLEQKDHDLKRKEKQIEELRDDKKTLKAMNKELRDEDESLRQKIIKLNENKKKLEEKNSILEKNENKLNVDNGKLQDQIVLMERLIAMERNQALEREARREEARREEVRREEARREDTWRQRDAGRPSPRQRNEFDFSDDPRFARPIPSRARYP